MSDHYITLSEEERQEIFDEGLVKGRIEGFKQGYNKGLAEGYANGCSDGYNEGYREAKEKFSLRSIPVEEDDEDLKLEY